MGTVPMVKVDCDRGQKINDALSKLDKSTPYALLVKGTCTEYVVVTRFDGLTLQGNPTATLVQPDSLPNPGSVGAVLTIDSSRNVTVDGFRIQKRDYCGVAIEQGSADVRLRNTTVEGGSAYSSPAVVVTENAQASISGVTVRGLWYAGIAIFDLASAYVERCVIEPPTGEAGTGTGIWVLKAFANVRGTTISGIPDGIRSSVGGILDVQISPYSLPGGDAVVIENARDAGILVDQGGTLLVNREVQIKEPGEQGVSTSGGVRVQDGSTFLVNSPLSIDGSLGQGLVVMGNSHAVLASNGSAPVAIRGSHRNGLVVANNSSVVVQDGAVRAEIASGLANDLVCDSTSLITGTGNITYSPALVQCEHLLPSATDPTLW